jgi:hypothetical protein
MRVWVFTVQMTVHNFFNQKYSFSSKAFVEKFEARYNQKPRRRKASGVFHGFMQHYAVPIENTGISW